MVGGGARPIIANTTKIGEIYLINAELPKIRKPNDIAERNEDMEDSIRWGMRIARITTKGPPRGCAFRLKEVFGR